MWSTSGREPGGLGASEPQSGFSRSVPGPTCCLASGHDTTTLWPPQTRISLNRQSRVSWSLQSLHPQRPGERTPSLGMRASGRCCHVARAPQQHPDAVGDGRCWPVRPLQKPVQSPSQGPEPGTGGGGSVLVALGYPPAQPGPATGGTGQAQARRALPHASASD